MKENGAPDVSGPVVSDASQGAPIGPPVGLVFLTQPATGAPNVPEKSIQIAVVDASNRVVPTATNQVTLSLGTNPSGAVFLGAPTTSAIAGSASFPTVGVDRTGTGYTLVASSPNLSSATSMPFDVVAPFAPITSLSGGYILDLAFAGSTQPTLYARTSFGVVYKSTNHAASWTFADFGDPNTDGRLAGDPSNPNVVYTSGDSAAPMGKTSNGGAVWSALAIADQGCFAIDPTNPSVLYTGTRRSTDGGTTWSPTGFPAGCVDLAIDPATPTTLYALAANVTTGATMGVYKSTDSGATWSPTNDATILEAGLGTVPQRIAALPTGLFVLETGSLVYRSTDGGASWQQSPTFGVAIGSSPANPARVYLGNGGTLGSVSISTDGGATFPTSVNVGGGAINAITVDPTNANLVYVGATSGVYASIDGGMTWTPASTGIPCMPLTTVAVAPGAPSILYVGATTVLRSADSGLTWTLGPTLSPTDSVGAIAIDPAATNNVYACGGFSGPVFFSRDAGLTWTAGSGSSGGCEAIAVHGSTIWAASLAGLFRSTDSGVSWTTAGVAPPAYSVAVGPTGATTYIGALGGTYQSTNGGASWTSMDPSDPAVSMLVDPLTPTTLYAATSCTVAPSLIGVQRSLDSGMSWTRVLATSECPGAITSTPSGILFAIDNTFLNPAGSGGVRRSADHGTTWAALGIGSARQVAAASDGTTVYAATAAGLYKSVTGGL